LEGPAYFVSNGGEAFPNLIVVLRGYGITLDLVGSTYISEKTGIASSGECEKSAEAKYGRRGRRRRAGRGAGGSDALLLCC
jgi:hypothetical protein